MTDPKPTSGLVAKATNGVVHRLRDTRVTRWGCFGSGRVLREGPTAAHLAQGISSDGLSGGESPLCPA
jgi:hypothetical protein